MQISRAKGRLAGRLPLVIYPGNHRAILAPTALIASSHLEGVVLLQVVLLQVR
ncbi:MAG: hypothetical protein J2P48_00245 [Alphaproteobacteria bacterium]|nr:hypothetical protein [Alphaproteobacteria bacterium]